jgi:hypothetical protein
MGAQPRGPCGGGERGLGDWTLGEKEDDRRSVGGGESVRAVSGEVSW